MQGKQFIWILVALLWYDSIQAQCLERDSLWSFLQTIKNESKIDYLPQLLSLNDQIKKCPYRNDSTNVLLLRSIGNKYILRSDYLTAAQYFRQAIEMVEQNKDKSSINYKAQILNYYYLSVVYESLNNVSQQLTVLDSCASVSLRINSVEIPCLWAWYARAQNYFDVGDFKRCIRYAKLCEYYGKEYANRGPDEKYREGLEYVSSGLHWHVNALLELKDYSEAEKLLNDRLKESKEKDDSTNLGILYEQLAEVHAHKKDLPKSLQSFRQAYNLAWAKKDTVDCMSILNNIAYFIYHRNSRNLDSALWYYRKALSLSRKKSEVTKYGTIEALNILNGMASAFIDKRLFDSGYKYYQHAFDEIGPGMNEREIVKIPLDELSSQRKIKYVSSLVIDKGVAYQNQYKFTREKKHLENAIRIYKLADQFLGRIKSNLLDTDSKLFWLKDSRRLYQHSIDACYESGDIADAFYFFEKSRAVLLNDQLAEQRWIGEAEILKQTQAKKRVAQLESELADANNPSPKFRKIQEELYFNRQQLDSLVAVIKSKNPFYYQNFLDSGRVSLQDVLQKVLLRHSALVEIFAGDSSVFVLTITKKKSNLFRIDRSRYDSLSRAYISYLSDPILLNKDYTGFTSVSRSLFDFLLSKADIPAGRIIISPDGHYFPFESLITNKSTEAPTYFLDQHAVSYTYSARYLLNNFETNHTSAKDFIGIAPVQYHKRLGLSTLPGSDGSLQKLKTYFRNTENLISTDASKANFLRNYNQYRIVQLYTHATDNGENGEPIIWFADSALLLSELIYEARPMSQLIVLSACETAKGKLFEGEGVFSFNRGFAAVGIPTSVSNLWSVDNESTYRVTELFYQYLTEGEPMDVALQKAKLEFVQKASKKNQLPYYWAAPVLVGMNHAIEIEKSNDWLSWLLIVGILAGLSLIAYAVYSRTNSRKYERQLAK